MQLINKGGTPPSSRVGNHGACLSRPLVAWHFLVMYRPFFRTIQAGIRLKDGAVRQLSASSKVSRSTTTLMEITNDVLWFVDDLLTSLLADNRRTAPDFYSFR